MTHEFDIIARRALYGQLLAFSPAPAAAEKAGLHSAMERLWTALYNEPGLLGLACDPDDSFEWDKVNNTRPELNEKYLKIYKTVYEFWKFLQAMAGCGTLENGALVAAKDALKAQKAAYKSSFAPLLRAAGFEACAGKSEVSLSYPGDGAVIAALPGLYRACAARTESADYPDRFQAAIRPLFDFMRCAWDGDFSYILERMDAGFGMGGLLMEMRERCLREGYEERLFCDPLSTSMAFSIDIVRGVGGFHIAYNPRKTQQAAFGTKNGIGEKAMLENFAALDGDMQAHFAEICRPCSGCMGCAKGGKNRPFTVEVEFRGEKRALCPMFPRHEWDKMTRERMEVLFKYHELQEKYA